MEDNQEQQETFESLQQRIEALGDIALLLEHYYKNTPYEQNSADSFNIAGFEAAHIRSSFGWQFANLAKPTLEQLEQIKAEHF
jgi:hypothetical protein